VGFLLATDTVTGVRDRVLDMAAALAWRWHMAPLRVRVAAGVLSVAVVVTAVIVAASRSAPQPQADTAYSGAVPVRQDLFVSPDVEMAARQCDEALTALRAVAAPDGYAHATGEQRDTVSDRMEIASVRCPYPRTSDVEHVIAAWMGQQ